MKIESISVIVMRSGILESIDTFTKGNEAENFFVEKAHELFTSIEDADLEAGIEDGIYEQMNGVEIIIAHSFPEDKKSTYKYHCNNCYTEGNKNNEEGCFTNEVEEFMQKKDSSCLNGEWDDGDTPSFKKIK